MKIILEYQVGIQLDGICIEAISGQRALDIIADDIFSQNNFYSSFKLILMDYEMPEMNGPECANKIRNMLYVKNIEQPIIVGITGHTNSKFLKIAIDRGMNTVFPKLPFPEEHLKQLIRQCEINQD